MPTTPISTTPPLPGTTLVNNINSNLDVIDAEIASEAVTRAAADVAEAGTRAAADATKAPIANPIFTGSVTLPGAPTNPLHAVTKSYADGLLSNIEIPDDVIWPDNRPGERPELWTSNQSGLDPDDLAPLSESLAANGSDGRVIRVTGSAIVLPRFYAAVEPARVYNVRWVVRRRGDTNDPAGDAVRMAISFYDQSKVLLSNLIVLDKIDLTIATGRFENSVLISRTAGSGITTAPANARYCRPYLHTLGGAVPVTDFEIIDFVDVTDADIFSPDVASLQSDVDALESQDLDARLTAVEATISGPIRLTYLNQAAAIAATVPVTVQWITLLGGSTIDDGQGGDFIRTSGGVLLAFTSADGAQWKRKTIPASPVYRERLLASRTYYVRPDGSNGNDGLTDSAGGAFLTKQAAVNQVAFGLDCNNKSVKIKCSGAADIDAVPVALHAPIGIVDDWNAQTLVIEGDPSDHDNKKIWVAGEACFSAVGCNVPWRIQGFNLASSLGSGSAPLIKADFGARVYVGNNTFYVCIGGIQLQALYQSMIELVDDYTISGGAAVHMYADTMSQILSTVIDVTVITAPNFTSGFAASLNNSIITAALITYIGSATGVRYLATTGGGINVGGLGANFFPGNSAGIATAPGWYS